MVLGEKHGTNYLPCTVMQLNNLSLMENIILHEVDLGIMQGKHYQGIYRDCKKRLEAVKDLAYLEAV